MAIYRYHKQILAEANIKVSGGKDNAGIKQINIVPDINNSFQHGPRYKVELRNKDKYYWIPMDPVTYIPNISGIKSEDGIPSNDVIKFICGLAVYAHDEIKEFLCNSSSSNALIMINKCAEYVNLKSKDQYISIGYSQTINKYNEDRRKGKGNRL